MEFIADYQSVMLASIMPIIEARGAVILGISLGLPPIWVMLIATVVSFVTAFAILLGLTYLTSWVRTWHPAIDKFFAAIFHTTYHRHSQKFERWGTVALTIFVAIPLPFSGAWTGALLAYLFGIKLHHSAILLLIGIFLSVIISAAATLGGVALLSL
ncbi:MAG: small multi-drug export protein [Patescibacteria group bacterium]|nr:small multi-drug export protein [Patescibacteria group bacterium]